MPNKTENTFSPTLPEKLFFMKEIEQLLSKAMQCNAKQCNAKQCNAKQCNAKQCNAKHLFLTTPYLSLFTYPTILLLTPDS